MLFPGGARQKGGPAIEKRDQVNAVTGKKRRLGRVQVSCGTAGETPSGSAAASTDVPSLSIEWRGKRCEQDFSRCE